MYSGFVKAYNGLYNALGGVGAPEKPTYPSNEEIEAKLSASDSATTDFSIKTEFWNNFTWDDGLSSSYNPYLSNLILGIKKKELAFDLGSGIGNDTRFLLDSGWKVTAVEISTEAIKCLNGIESKNIKVIQSPLKLLSFLTKLTSSLQSTFLVFVLLAK